jgi:hypothetical protein
MTPAPISAGTATRLNFEQLAFGEALTTARSFRIERLGLFRIEAYRDTADDGDTRSLEATSFAVWIVSRWITSAMPVPILSFLVAQPPRSA